MSSILVEYKLTIEKFEGAIAVGRTSAQILTMFHKSSKEMDAWCAKNYQGNNFKTVYEWVRQCTVETYLHCVHELGIRGNPSALGIIDRAIQKDESMNTVKIVFNAGLPAETDEDKLNDSEDDC